MPKRTESPDRDNEDIFQPPHNSLSTPLGRRIENVTYLGVGLTALLTIIASAAYFLMAAGGGNGLDKCGGSTLQEALYFSIVTFSTVGYGDFAPQGWGRLVANTEMLTGLILTALFIGKIASERQSALLLLIYTSDQQRRIAKFASEIREFYALLLGPTLPLPDKIRDCKILARSLTAYLTFQSHQGRLADFGNGSALRNLYKAIFELQSGISQRLGEVTFLEPESEAGVVQVSERMARLAEAMKQFHAEERGQISLLRAICSKGDEVKKWETRSVTRRRQEQVKAIVPERPWPKHFHKAAADSLGISHKVFRACMDTLIKMNKI